MRFLLSQRPPLTSFHVLHHICNILILEAMEADTGRHMAREVSTYSPAACVTVEISVASGRSAATLTTIKSRLKTFLFAAAFNWTIHILHCTVTSIHVPVLFMFYYLCFLMFLMCFMLLMSFIFGKHFELPCVEKCYINKLALPFVKLWKWWNNNTHSVPLRRRMAVPSMRRLSLGRWM